MTLTHELEDLEGKNYSIGRLELDYVSRTSTNEFDDEGYIDTDDSGASSADLEPDNGRHNSFIHKICIIISGYCQCFDPPKYRFNENSKVILKDSIFLK